MTSSANNICATSFLLYSIVANLQTSRAGARATLHTKLFLLKRMSLKLINPPGIRLRYGMAVYCATLS